jgi:hypothetical protein
VAGLFKWGAPKAASSTPSAAPLPAVAAASSDTVATSRVFPHLLSALAHHPAPVLLDLGPVVGSNVTFFGERLACKIHVGDLFAEVERAAVSGGQATLAQAMLARLTQPDESVDGILCWDLFDFLDRRTGQLLAQRLAQLVSKGGVLHGFFGTTPMELRHYSRYVIEAADTLRARIVPATPAARTVRLTGEIIKMFEGLVVVESVLLKSKTSETLFRRA